MLSFGAVFYGARFNKLMKNSASQRAHALVFLGSIPTKREVDVGFKRGVNLNGDHFYIALLAFTIVGHHVEDERTRARNSGFGGPFTVGIHADVVLPFTDKVLIQHLHVDEC